MMVVDILKQIQADSIVFYMKLHNLHWNVKGLLFKPIHESTEAIYDEFAEIFDAVAIIALIFVANKITKSARK